MTPPAEGRQPVPGEEDLLLSLSRGSTLLVSLRALYSLMLDYGVYVPDGGEPLVFSKEQLVVLVERGQADAPLKDMPVLAGKGLFRPVAAGDLDGELSALVVERRGARVLTLARALNPSDEEYPEWWEAPIPFAMSTRAGMKLNATAVLMFGSDLERLKVAELPDKDEFIVQLEGRARPVFLAFRRLEPNIFVLDDCTGDLVEAQDISWWAAVGRAWVSEIEARGQRWRRADSPSGAQSWPCEWQGRFLGYLCVDGTDALAAGAPAQPEPEGPKKRASKPKKRAARRASTGKPAAAKEDEVLKAIGPQTMALLAAGQGREDLFDPMDSENRQGRGRK
ncbi:MAG: hypothetical protein IJ702_05560 [Fretibacterium sp.]|nr:hypothetical protein [Fretibacterium sp.]